MGLREKLQGLASRFADEIMAAVRETPLADIAGGERKPANVVTDRPARTGRLPRRSAAVVDLAVDRVATLLGTSPGGMRAEDIRVAGSFDVREMPRILKQGIASKRFKILSGQKRATLYGFASAKPVKLAKKRAAKRVAKKR